jgi:uncharacterized protein YbjT (DUF2867 family)
MDLVVGATGMLGSEIALQLRQKQRPVRALVRANARASQLALLRNAGIELVYGDLKEPATLRDACAGISHIISTASATQSRSSADDIASVDQIGQRNLIEAAQRVATQRFVFVSFPPSSLHFPLQAAKRASEAMLRESVMPYTILQPPHFFETWFSVELGFDWRRRTARFFGSGEAKVSFVSFKDVARAAVLSLENRAAQNQTLVFGGPSAVSQRDITTLFERMLGATFTIETIDRGTLEAQAASAPDTLSRSFAALMLLCGDREDFKLPDGMAVPLAELPRLSAEQFVRSCSAPVL